MGATDVEDLTIEYTEDGQLVTRQLDKIVLTKGAWSTIIFRYQDWDRRNLPKSKFNISSRDQARKIVEALETWLAEPEAPRD